MSIFHYIFKCTKFIQLSTTSWTKPNQTKLNSSRFVIRNIFRDDHIFQVYHLMSLMKCEINLKKSSVMSEIIIRCMAKLVIINSTRYECFILLFEYNSFDLNLINFIQFSTPASLLWFKFSHHSDCWCLFKRSAGNLDFQPDLGCIYFRGLVGYLDCLLNAAHGVLSWIKFYHSTR